MNVDELEVYLIYVAITKSRMSLFVIFTTRTVNVPIVQKL